MSKQEVVICHNLEENLQKAVTSKTYDKLFILTDEHTRTYCLPIIEKYPFLAQAEHICIGVEDIHKNLETLAYVWSQLSNKGGTRHSLMINLGGGMITDWVVLLLLLSNEVSTWLTFLLHYWPW